MLHYRLTFEPDDNGTVLVTSPDFPLVTYGADKDEAQRNAVDAAEAIFASMMDAREDIPVRYKGPDEEDVLQVPLQTALKVALYAAMRARKLTRADLQRLLGWQRESVDRLFRLDHNSKIEQFEAAFRSLDSSVDVSVTPLPRLMERIS